MYRIPRIIARTPIPSIRLSILTPRAASTMSTSPTSSTSPVHKKARTEGMIPVDDAPVNALFVPSNGESSTRTSTSTNTNIVTKDVPAPVKGQVQGKKKNRRMKRYLPEPYSPADVTYRDVRDFLGGEYVDQVLAKGDESEWASPAELELWSIHELTVGAFTVSGKSPLLPTLRFTHVKIS